VSRPRRRSARYNPVYSFGCTIQNTACQMRFTSITGAFPLPRAAAGPRRLRPLRRASALTRLPGAGHLLDSDFGPAWRGWRSCSEGDLIDPAKAQIVTNVRRDCEALETLLKAEARGAQWLILWLDCDREGELYQFTCFTGAKAQILTQKVVQRGLHVSMSIYPTINLALSLLALLVHKYKY
jgi:DNA topoisomerase-3